VQPDKTEGVSPVGGFWESYDALTRRLLLSAVDDVIVGRFGGVGGGPD
jgi:hypothetical protein